MPTTTKRLGYLLIASLAVNLFLGGLYAGQWLDRWRHHGDDGAPPPTLHLPLGPVLEHLPAEQRARARAVMERHRPAIRSAFQEARQARRQVREALRAEPFEPARLEARLAEMRRLSERARAEMHAAMLELAGELPPEARHAVAERMERRPGPPPAH